MTLTSFISLISEEFPIFVTVLITLSVAFVNGWTDAPNAIASCVASRSLDLKKAVCLAAAADFMGALAVCFFGAGVMKTVINIADFGSGQAALIALCAAMSAVVVWAAGAWAFGIPTSESHALVAGLTGASVALNGGFSGVGTAEWAKVFAGLAVSSLSGFSAGLLFAKLTAFCFANADKRRADRFFASAQIFSSAFTAFMHGMQDSQKFVGVLVLVVNLSNTGGYITSPPVWMLLLCSAVIAAGTALGGGRIIKAVGMDMVRLRSDLGFSADMAGAVCLAVSTAFGLPVSTTQTKTSAMLGAGVSRSARSADWRIAFGMAAAWVLTLPGCGLLGWASACLFLKIFSGVC